MYQVNLAVAFLAGGISFLAPCLLPLLPIFISYITGVSVIELKKGESRYRTRILLSSLLYIFGFTLTFTLLGLSATSLGRVLIANKPLFAQISGLIIIVFGLFNLGLFKGVSFVQKEHRLNLPPYWIHLKILGPILMGITFALAWTPCAGAVLGAILTLAAVSSNVFQGALLLFVYSLGISVPFLLVALTISKSTKILSNLGSKLHILSIVCGIFLVILGVLMLTNMLADLNGVLLNLMNRIPLYKGFQVLL